MKWVSGAKYAAAVAGQQRALKELESANKRDAERQATITRQAAEIARLRDEKPDSPVQNPQPAQGDAELRRQLNLANRAIREQADQLERLQDSHLADTRELHDLRQGVAP
ncbi:hypothetical protein [Streptomyces caniscabiei]|uniref:hypothetical protein n=1 Tax=Streptomyces caniscabiei TaxID=2746961 RepID=UPI00187335D6|nr:hypothetical protein [Streptomyces caniscabiei]MBE4735763.1 hypothetical protein [Streptomyces caniscabiei]MBE4758380.1 hypothetical protein [Streptomyces caniscabiei]MBE4788471.1 hypothetical protein [Streptomyces caniscabiei]MDX2986389.1 hypothetical protein [Streptomyces caniscabiei]